MLGPLRLVPEKGRGRRYPELPHPYRNDFQRDRDRVIHARAFRRMEGKTQVFAPNLSDHFRNRLTHTLEVSQIARTVACTLGLNEEFTETLALAHDIGHPPFGHAGERELDLHMRRYGLRFEHNLHSLRLVDTLEQRYARFDGLNLTFEVREGIVKHSREVTEADGPELAEFLPGLRPPVEAQLIDLADEVAYNTSDLDDGYAAGMFSLEDAVQAVPGVARLAEEGAIQFPGVGEKIRFREILRSLINELVGGLIQGTLDLARQSGARDVEDVRRLGYRIAAFTPPSAALQDELKAFLTERVYLTQDLTIERRKAAKEVGALFEYLASAPENLPADQQEQLQSLPTARVTCDFIAGMTDAYFRRFYGAFC
jgi:dGTPase